MMITINDQKVELTNQQMLSILKQCEHYKHMNRAKEMMAQQPDIRREDIEKFCDPDAFCYIQDLVCDLFEKKKNSFVAENQTWQEALEQAVQSLGQYNQPPIKLRREHEYVSVDAMIRYLMRHCEDSVALDFFTCKVGERKPVNKFVVFIAPDCHGQVLICRSHSSKRTFGWHIQEQKTPVALKKLTFSMKNFLTQENADDDICLDAVWAAR